MGVSEMTPPGLARKTRSSGSLTPHAPQTIVVLHITSSSNETLLDLEHGRPTLLIASWEWTLTDPLVSAGKAQEVQPTTARAPKGAQSFDPQYFLKRLNPDSENPWRPLSPVFSVTMRTRLWSS